MNLYHETSIRKKADGPTVAMLDLWKSLSEEKTGIPIEVMVGNRKEQSRLSLFPGEVHTAWPSIVDERVVLVLYFDSLSNVKPVIVTHELGHWILKLQGFSGLIYKPDKHNNTEIFLNSMAHHVPLYILQKSLGHDPQGEIDSRALHNIKLFSRRVKRKERKDLASNAASNALMLSDDIMNCSVDYRTSLENVLINNWPNISKLVRKIVKVASSYDLQDATQNLKFSERLVQELGLGNGWCKAEEESELASMVRETHEDKKKSESSKKLKVKNQLIRSNYTSQ